MINLIRKKNILKAKGKKFTPIKKNVTEDNFLTYTAHEIRSSLNFILNTSEIILSGVYQDLFMKYVANIHSSAQRINHFVSDILDEQNKKKGKFKIVNALNKIEDIITTVVEYYSWKKDVSIVTNFEDNLPLLICDKKRMMQIIDNLVSNAIKYSGKFSSITISVKMSCDQMLIMISNTKISKENDKFPLLLKKQNNFHQKVDIRAMTSYGIGISIVKKLLELHEAAINIDSTDKNDTKIKVTFPKIKTVYN